jgi:hypothetical protein
MRMRAYYPRFGLRRSWTRMAGGQFLWLSRYTSSRESNSKRHSMIARRLAFTGKEQGACQKWSIYGVSQTGVRAGCVSFVDTACLLGKGHRAGLGGDGRLAQRWLAAREWSWRGVKGLWAALSGQKYLLSTAPVFPIYSVNCTFFGVRVNRIYP